MTTDEAVLAGSVDTWLACLARGGELGRLLAPPSAEQVERGYGHTLREIGQQPVTWIETAALMVQRRREIGAALVQAGVRDRSGSLVLTGSGSSLFVGETLAVALQEALGISVVAIAAGQLLTHPRGCLPPEGPFLAVSFARSGNSPESRAVVDLILETAPRARHLVITCNRDGELATAYAREPRVLVVVLDEKTADRSLVMTSSFTNMALAGQGLVGLAAPAEYELHARRLALCAGQVLERHGEALAAAARSAHSVVYLGSGPRLGSAREAALKMLEMTGARVSAMAESFLGLRHGPMSAVQGDTLVAAFLSSDPMVRAYELDLLSELTRKGIGSRRVLVGADVPAELARGDSDVVVDCGPAGPLGDAELTLIDVLVGQLLAFFRCLAAGLRPDSPSDGIINRVVEAFAIHRRPQGPA